MRLVFDLETDGLLPNLTKIHCLAVKDIDTEKVYSFEPIDVGHGIRMLSEADELIGHNILCFDIPAIKKVFPNVDMSKPKLTDTLVLSRLIHSDIRAEDYEYRALFPSKLVGSHSLKAWGVRLGNDKGDFDGGDWQTWSPEMQTYCVQDVEVSYDLYKHLDPENFSQDAIELEHDAALICERIGSIGWVFDNDKAVQLYSKLVEERDKLEVEFSQLFEPWQVEIPFIPKRDNKTKGYKKGELFTKIEVVHFNPNSRQHIEHCLKRKYDWKPSQLTEGGRAKIDEKTLNALKYPEAKKLAKFFLLQKRLGQLNEGRQGWMRLVDKDGRIRHRLNHNGTLTGRASHQRPNLAQVPATRAPWGQECRELFTVPDGYSLVGADLSGLELRCLAHYMDDGGEYGRQILEGDVHTANQKSAGLETRDQAKTFIYALLYGAGNELLGQVSGGNFALGKRLRDNFEKAQPAYKRLREKTMAVSENRGYLQGLDGRRLRVRSPHSSLNLLLQSCGAILCKKWMQLVDSQLDADTAYICGWIHDELQIVTKKGFEDDVGNITRRMAKETGQFYKFNLPVEAEYHVGDTWATTH